MSGQELELLRNLSAKMREIESVVAKAYGIGHDLDPSARRRFITSSAGVLNKALVPGVTPLCHQPTCYATRGRCGPC